MHVLVLLLCTVGIATAIHSDEQTFICTAALPTDASNIGSSNQCSSDELTRLMDQLLQNHTANSVCNPKALDEKLQTIETQLEAIMTNVTSNHTSILSQLEAVMTHVTSKHASILSQLDVIGATVNELASGPPFLLQSCAEVKQKWPSSSSGFYSITDAKGNTVTTYCEMGSLCSEPGPWTRIAFLDMSDPSTDCPADLQLYTRNSVRACGRSQGLCQSLYFNSPLGKYTAVCGKVKGYQYKTTDAFYSAHVNTIDGNYVDGVSITYGFQPRKHLWTYAAGAFQSVSTKYDCPCSNGHTQTAPNFVGSHYYCESGNQHGSSNAKRLYEEDPLWDRKGCGSSETYCCQRSTMQPWFYRTFALATSEYLELRICSDDSSSQHEDVPVSQYELYVQ